MLSIEQTFDYFKVSVCHHFDISTKSIDYDVVYTTNHTEDHHTTETLCSFQQISVDSFCSQSVLL